MNKKMKWLFSLLLMAGSLLAACSQGSEPASEATAPPAATLAAATDVPATAPVPTVAEATSENEPIAEPTTAEPTATVPASPAQATNDMVEVDVNGRNPDGTYFRGRADAPVVLIDYSDFF